jgi:hypothetical protein
MLPVLYVVICSESFYGWIDYAEDNYIPVKIVIEDDSWFGNNEVDIEIINHLKQNNIWGAVS